MDDGDKNDDTRHIDEKGRLRCPMCKGRGYFEPTQQKRNHKTDYFYIDGTGKASSSLKLPTPGSKECLREKVTLPSIKSSLKNFLDRKSVENMVQNKSNIPSPVNDDRRINYQDVVEDINTGPKRSFLKPNTASSGLNEGEFDHLLPSPKTPKNPHEGLKSSLLKLKGTDWNGAVSGLKDIVQISRYEPELVEGSMVLVYRGIITLLRSFRSKVTRTACQAANELFSNSPSTQGPEFDELVNVLLQKTADTNKCVRRDANEALDSMVINILPQHAVRILTQKGVPHRNATVRAAAMRLIVCIVGLVGVRNIFSGNKETRNRIVNAAAQLLQDGSQDVRAYACRIMKMLMENEDFDEVLQCSVDGRLINRIEKCLINLKYRKR